MRGKRTIAILVVAATAALSAGTASADNYGGVSRATEQKMKNLIYAHFGSGWKGQAMIRCARRESGFNPRAANWRDSNGGSFGLLQINGIHRRAGESTMQFAQRMWNPYENLKVAVRLARGGLGPWGGGC